MVLGAVVVDWLVFNWTTVDLTVWHFLWIVSILVSLWTPARRCWLVFAALRLWHVVGQNESKHSEFRITNFPAVNGPLKAEVPFRHAAEVQLR